MFYPSCRVGLAFALKAAMRHLLGLLLLSLATAPACGPALNESGGGADGGVEELPFVFEKPSLDQVTPQSMALGDTVQVFGNGFVPTKYGTTRMHLVGTYQDENGATHDYEGDLNLTVKNSSVASFLFDDLVFIPSKDRIGVFSGDASIESELHEEYRLDDIEFSKSSSTKSVSLTVKPSIGVVQMRSVTEPGCSPITKSTVGDQELGFSVQTIGFGEASTSSPIRFRVTFQSPTMKVVYVKDSGYSVWPIPELSPAFSAEAREGENRFEIAITQGNRLDLDPSYRRDRVTVSPPVQMGQESYSQVLLGRFSTGSTDGQSTTASIMVEALRADGTSLRRLINYDIRESWEIQSYNQSMLLMERSDPVPVSGCYPGGDVGTDLTYTEGSSVTQSRSLSFRWDRNIANTLGVNAGVGGLLPVQISANASSTFSETFGVDVNETVSSESHVGINYSKRIIPGYFGKCYRQTEKLQREVDVVYTNACGARGVIGQTLLTDWNFGFDIASGPSCETPSDLDEGGNYEPDGIQID